MVATGSLSKTDVDAIAEQVRNWGRWGDDDERGALNLITDAKRAQAAALVQEGVVVSCALELPVRPGPDNANPVQHHITRGGDAQGGNFGGSADYFAIAPHGYATTHLDALCHIFVDGKMYNGYDQAEVRSDGAQKNSIMAGKDGIVSRGVLLDIARLRGVDWLELGEQITADDLSAAETAQGVRVEEGDILLVATGRDARRASEGAWSAADGLAGLYADCLPWLHERGVATLGCDGVSDVAPSGVDGWPMPMHQIAIVAMGVHLIDNMRLDGLSAACAERDRWAFQFVLAPLRLDKGTASPVNPLAIF
jgi:kynurenine formamidase